MKSDALHVRHLSAGERAAWSRLRAALWPDQSADEHLAEIDGMLADGSATGYGVFTRAGTLLAFSEVSIRPYANGCTCTPVPFLEGVYVAEAGRRSGAASLLLAAIEEDLRADGHLELCSDAEIHNTVSHAAHRNWGFIETERVIYFRKPLGNDPSLQG